MYVLMGKLVVPEPDPFKWAIWFETAKRHVAHTKIGPIWISTVFLGLDHSFGRGLPMVFETMIFRGGEASEQWRYESWDEAEEGHKRAVQLVRDEIKASATAE